ncbi:MAG: hypothetical protein KJO07_00755, partial [Deltaproteobacteria bacterium]|nr:hypothetical protein [Deltaproteobacteria bacterium]
MGFFDSISKGWEFMKQALAMARDDRSLLKPSVYQVLLSIVYWVIWVGVFIGADIDPESSTGAILGAVSLFGSFLIFYFFCGVTVNMIDVHLRGGTPSVKDGIADARQNFGAICVLALISTFVELLAKAARRRGEGGAAIVTSIIASIIETIWTVVAFLLLPAIIIEDCSLGDALKRVRALHKGNFLLVGLGEVGVRVVTNLFGFLVTLLIFGLGYVSFAVLGGTAGLVIGILSIGTVLSLFIAFATYLRMAYYTCL